MQTCIIESFVDSRPKEEGANTLAGLRTNCPRSTVLDTLNRDGGLAQASSADLAASRPETTHSERFPAPG